MPKEFGLSFLRFLRADHYVFATWKYFLVLLPILMIRRPLGDRPKVYVLAHGLELSSIGLLTKQILIAAVASYDVQWIANSEFTRRRVECLGLSKNCVVLRPSVFLPDLDRVSDCSSDLHSAGSLRRRVITVSRLVERKNLFIAIDAIAALNKAGLDLEYWIVGDGPLRGDLERYAADQGAGRVRLTGSVDESTKWRLLVQSSLFLLPSIDSASGEDIEGYGIALIEANWAGLPVVAGPSGGMPEAVLEGITGVVSDGSVESIANAIKGLLVNPPVKDSLREWALKHQVGQSPSFSSIHEGVF